MKKLMLFAISFLFAAASAYAQQPSTGAADAAVPIEEYVPKVIIEGKWGTGPGEFGAIADPMQSEQYDAPQFPGSLAVNAAGEIYVLDHVNGRIQKFSKEGKYLASLVVPGCADENGKSAIEIETGDKGEISFELRRKPAIIGINIVIDGKDDLYYYLKRTNDGKESGEVWQFREDRLVKKTSVPPVPGVLDVRDGEIWISQYPFAFVRTDIGEDYSLSEKKKIPRKQVNSVHKQKMEKLLTVKKEGRSIVGLRKENKGKFVLIPIDGEEFEGEAAIKGASIQAISRKGERAVVNRFDLSGKLLRRISVGTQPVTGIRDSRDNVYQLIKSENGLQVRRLGLEPLRQ